MSRTIWLSASHDGTVGAGREGLYEEYWSEPIIIEAVNRLNALGHSNVVWMGVNGHEMDQDDDGSIGNEDVVISLHFNVGNAMVLYNQNPANINWIDAYFRAHLPKEINYSGAIYRDDLDMLYGDYDNAERYLLEMGDVRDADDRAWMSNQEFMINFLVGLVLEIFLGAGPQNPHDGVNSNPNPSPSNPPSGGTPEQTDGYGLVAQYDAPRGRITSHDPDKIIGWNDVLRASDSGVGLYDGEYFESTDTEYLVRIQGDDNYIMRQSKTSNLYFAIGTWLYDDNGQRGVDELYKVSFGV